MRASALKGIAAGYIVWSPNVFICIFYSRQTDLHIFATISQFCVISANRPEKIDDSSRPKCDECMAMDDASTSARDREKLAHVLASTQFAMCVCECVCPFLFYAVHTLLAIAHIHFIPQHSRYLFDPRCSSRRVCDAREYVVFFPLIRHFRVWLKLMHMLLLSI